MAIEGRSVGAILIGGGVVVGGVGGYALTHEYPYAGVSIEDMSPIEMLDALAWALIKDHSLELTGLGIGMVVVGVLQIILSGRKPYDIN